ncbi:hypothetical protein KJ660_00690 [Candidatus Micrarchaeota archaeon]|nr:hypothetical protein [Candidatus Micrarchaeota archaeon]
MGKSIFLDFMGDSPTTRVLEFLIIGREFDYCLTGIASNSKIGWTTLHRIFPSLEKREIVVPTRTIGRAKLYKLNQDSYSVKKLISLYDSLLGKELNEAEEKSKEKVMARTEKTRR